MKTIYDIGANSWTVEGSFGAFGGVLGFGFRNNSSLPVDLRGVASYGWTLGDSGADSYPKGGRLLSSALDVVVQKNLRLTPDTEYTITFFVELHEGGRQEFVHEFTTPIPAAPYASWTWDAQGKKHVSPVAKPEEGEFIWDEDTTSWVPDPMAALRFLGETDYRMARWAEEMTEIHIANGTLKEEDIPPVVREIINERKAKREHLNSPV